MQNENITENQIDQTAQRNAFYAFVISYIVVCLFSFLLKQYVALNNLSLSISIIVMSFFVPLITFFVYGRNRIRALSDRRKRTKTGTFTSMLIITLAFSVASVFAGATFSIFFSKAFKEFIYDPYSFSFWISLSVTVWIFVYTKLAQRIAIKDIVNLIGFYLIGGVATSAIFNPNPKWWDESVSYLGMNQLPSSKIFNASIIVSGLLLLTLSSFIINEFTRLYQDKKLQKEYLTFYSIAFVIAPIGLACVGFFPFGINDIQNMIHNLSAYTAFGIFGIIMASLYFSMKFLSKYFMRINYLLLAAMITGFALYGLEYFTLAINEIFAFGVVSIWLVFFLNNISSVGNDK